MSDHRGFSKAALTLHRLPVSRTSRPFKNLVAEMEKDKRSPQPKHDAQSADVSGKSEEREHSSSNDMRDDELKVNSLLPLCTLAADKFFLYSIAHFHLALRRRAGSPG